MSDEVEKAPDAVSRADDAYEAIRAINHMTQGSVLPAPLVYEVLGNLKGLGYLLPQALRQLSGGLGKSLNEYNVYEDDGRDPVESIATAADHLARSIELAAQLGSELDKAQTAIAGQGYASKS